MVYFCYKQEMEALFLVWYSGYDVFDTFSISNLFAAFATQRFILSYVKIKHVAPESYDQESPEDEDKTRKEEIKKIGNFS